MKKVCLFILLAVPVAYGQANLKNPSALKERAPAVYKVKFDTSAGVFEVEVHADWAPNGADRFYNLVNTRGFITFAKSGAPNSRTTQVFINFKDNSFLNRQGFSPFGRIIGGMEVVDKIYSGYGEQPEQGRLQAEGNAYLTKAIPKLDYIKKATIEP